MFSNEKSRKHIYLTLLDWKYSYFGYNCRQPEESTKIQVPPTLEMDIIRIQFQPGPYVHPDALISEINEGLRLTLHDLLAVLSTNPKEKSVKTLLLHPFSHTPSLKNGLWEQSLSFTRGGGGYD